jgi:intergrase/recombinase
MDMRLCRRIFASWLVQKGIDSITVDMLQGRCPASVLARHYQTPSNDLKDKVQDAVEELTRYV